MQVWIPHKPISYLEWKGHFKVENIKESFDWRSHKAVHATYLRLNICSNVEETISFWAFSQKDVYCHLFSEKNYSFYTRISG